jgi:hypothetical protein
MKTKLGLFGTLALSAIGLTARPAAAADTDLSSCGDIHVEAKSTCEVKVGVECQAECTPVNFEAACAADLAVECKGMCNAQASAMCTASCDVSACQAECEVDPGKFDCTAECSANADAHCQGECTAAGNKGECVASCKASIQAECNTSCEATPPSANCQARCQARCEGECRGEANVDCQVNCQSSGYVECEAQLEGGCKAQCDKPEGAVFCDTEYVDTGNNAEECIAALNAIITANVDVSARGSAECSGNSCEAEGEASCSARMSPTVPRGGAAAILAGFGLALVLGARRRKTL